MKEIVYKGKTLKTLDMIPANQSRIIRSKIETLAADPAELTNNVLKLKGRDEYRLRIGSWRVIFAENDGVIEILAIGPRGGIYR